MFGVTELAQLPGMVEPVVASLGAGGVLYVSNQAVARRGEKHVTPNSDPRDNDGRPLTPDQGDPDDFWV